MTIRTSRFVFLVFAATTWTCVSPAVCQAEDAAISPIPSATVSSDGLSSDGPVVVGQYGPCQDFAQPADGGGNIFARAFHSMALDFKRNNCWPRPFVWKDREATRASFVIMVNKGWQLENTLGAYHFDRETGKINEPGRRRVYWIVTQELPGRHAIFVHRAMRPEETEARVDSVQQWVAQIVPKGSLPPVLETGVPAPGRPAEEVDHIRQEYLKSMPAPRLPVNESMDTGSSSI